MATANKFGGVGRGQYGPGLKVVYTGPFFQRDPAKAFRENAREFIGEALRNAQAAGEAAAPVASGDYLAALQQGWRLKSVQTGKAWQVTGVVSLRTLRHPWRPRSGVFNKGGRVVGSGFSGWFNYAGKVEQRHHPMRRAKSTLYRARAHNRDLLRGLG